MTDAELNSRIHEIMGLTYPTWHMQPIKKWEESLRFYKCSLCSEPLNFTGNWQTSHYEFGLMFEFMQKHELWEDFCNKQEHISYCYCGKHVSTRLISPRAFAVAMCEFFKATKL